MKNEMKQSESSQVMLNGSGKSLEQVEFFAGRLQRESQRLFGNDPRRGRLQAIADALHAECEKLHQRGDQATPSIVILGRVGEGKSWLARCFLTDHPDNRSIRSEIVSGQNDADRTSDLIWFGSAHRFRAEQGEVFLKTSHEQMIDLGRDYVVGDAPGISDHDQSRQDLASLAARSAPIKLVVFSRDQVRDASLQDFIRTIDGALIVPVVKFRPANPSDDMPSAAAMDEVQTAITQWKQAAPHAQIVEPIYMPLEAIFGSEQAIELMRGRLKSALAPHLNDIRELQATVEREISQKLVQAKRRVADELADVRLRVGDYVERLDRATEQISGTLRHELLGEPIVLRAGIRRRLRADLIDRTPQICFPYRSFLGVLTLTAGAWDRLIFSIAGSVPSLAMTFFQSARNVLDARKSSKKIKQGVSERIERLVQDELRGEVSQFHNALSAVLDENDGRKQMVTSEVAVHGLESIEAESHNIFQHAINRHRGSILLVWLFALLGCGVFVYLIFGPIFSVYHEYVTVHSRVMLGDGTQWKDFPAPPWNLIASSFVLSVAPSLLIALIAVCWCCHRYRVERVMKRVTKEIDNKIKDQMANGSFRIELTDPQLDSARYLLSISDKAHG
jgi:hypothetical protein